MSASSGSVSSVSLSSSSGPSGAPSTEQVQLTTSQPEVVKPKSQKEEDEEALRELCLANGVNFNKIQSGEPSNIELLELFFSNYPRIVHMHLFPCLTSLCLVGQPIQKINGLDSLHVLKELWMCECQIKKIENLDSCSKIQRLYLYGNEIQKIENLSHMVHMEELWLNNNQIENIENLSTLTKIQTLNLAENRIEKIDHTLDANIELVELNLSGNDIKSLRDLTHLMRLPKLISLSLKDSVYSPAPVSLLCNYSTHVLYHLPNLTRLDTYDISKTVSDLAEATVTKKKMYYNMRVKTVRRNMAEILTKMATYKNRLLEYPSERMKVLMNCIKEVRKHFEELMTENMDFSLLADMDDNLLIVDAVEDKSRLQQLDEDGRFTLKMAALKERMKKWESKFTEVDSYHQEAINRVNFTGETLVRRMTIELESGGNVRFEEGSPSDVWFSSCHDLVLSRFCASDYKEHGIAGVKIHRIIRVHNRMLRNRFDEKLTSIVDDVDGEYYPSLRNHSYKKLLEYLFWMWDPNLPGGEHEACRVLEDGFMDAESYKGLGKEGAVPLSNSLSLADRHRIQHLNRQIRNKEMGDTCPFRYGQLIISKVFLGKSVKAVDERPVSGSAYPKIDAVFKPRKMVVPPNGDGLHSCECSTRQCEWYIFDNELVLPEYIVEFEYVTKFRSKSPFAPFNDVLLDNRECKIPAVPHVEEDKVADNDVIDMEPMVKPRPRITVLNDDLILRAAGAEAFEHITVLNLHDNGLTKVKPLHALKELKRLTLSFNELTRLDELSHMGIEFLDASFNNIETLEGLKNVQKLKFLDLSWNKLSRTREELSIMRKHTSNLLSLDIRHNTWLKPENLRLRVIGRLKSLTLLDGSAVTEIEATAALRVAAGSRISQLSLLTHSRTDNHRPRSLNLLSTAQIMERYSRLRPEKVGDNDNHWYTKVTSLNLDGQHITKLSGLEKLDNLKYASFNNNDITKLEGLDHCTKIEELSVENNCISKLEGISKLTHLRRFSAGNNYLATLEGSGIHCLTMLTYLSLENNLLTSLGGLQKMNSLVELYVGNNKISSVREVFFLKVLTSLVILDLYGNPVASETDNYRLFIIYHLKNLKALDGSAIEAMEGNQAKDTFGGRLTPDFVAEKLGHSNFQDVRELDLPNSSVRIVDLGMGDAFINLRSVNLEHNNLTSFSGLIHLPNLRVLCLNHNHVECIVPKQKPMSNKPVRMNQGNSRSLDLLNGDMSLTPIMENLEVLHLGYNGIKDMAVLQLSRLTSLKALFLQGNEIMVINGLEGLHDLRELVLDRNKVKNVSETSFNNQWNLQELHLEENRIRDLSNLNCMDNLQRLYLGSNRIQEISELEKLDGLGNLIEISLVNNAAARRHLHRPILVFKLKQILVIDGIPVSEEERAKAELYFMDQTPVPAAGQGSDPSLPGLTSTYKTQVPVKVTTMHLGNSPLWNGGVMFDDGGQDLQRGGGRRRSTKNGTENANPGPGSLNRANTVVYNNSQPQGYGGFSYTTNTGNRPQFYLNQIPYVNPPSQTEYVDWFSR
ncbi:hypothetical protein FSP39_012192 [Pinctada imbricata]|uniref:U2A'/phosphoprotein 32 family A C-terminal domain-containing protein n=1 Tax=Pinctada imbricata TaxID=66713 RepID=A0AA88XWJ7_PINIB|nr:hypothetical protein FSP39_012192 [Pinctada imbricata]